MDNVYNKYVLSKTVNSVNRVIYVNYVKKGMILSTIDVKFVKEIVQFVHLDIGWVLEILV